MSDQLVVFGAGGHAKVVVEAVLAQSRGREIILLDDCNESQKRSIFGIPVSGTRRELKTLIGTPIALAIGNNKPRAQLIEWLRNHGHIIETVVHPSAVVAPSVTVGAGTFVSAGAVVVAEARVGAAAIINTAASVDHDCVIGEAAHVAPGAHLCGNVQIGARVLVGVGCSIRPGVSVCDDVVLGAGAVVIRDIDSPGTYVGNPARFLK